MRYRPVCIFVSLLLLLFPMCAFAAPTVHFGPEPTWIIKAKDNNTQPNLREVGDGYYIYAAEIEVNVAKSETYRHIIKHIVSDAGVQGASNLSINFNPAYEQLTVHQINVRRDGKQINKLQKSAFKVMANETDLSRFIYDGNYNAYLILEDIRAGDMIEYSYTITGRNPVFENKFFDSYTFQASDPIPHLHYCILSPAGRTYNFKYFNGAAKPVVSNVPNGVLYEWDLLNVKGMQPADNVPQWFTPYPYVEISEYRNWGEVADWAYKINTPEPQVKGALGKRVAALQAQYGTDKAALCRAIADVVQNEIRYMGVELGPYSHKANSPEKVYDQRYGDCKDKSMLLVSMLRSVGIDAEIALVSAEYRSRIEEDLPSPYVFNHAIAVAHIFNSDIWIDPTIAGQGGKGIDFYCPDYGRALVLAPGTTGLKIIPDMPAGQINCTEEYRVTDPNSPVTLIVNTSYSSGNADDVRNTYANESKSELEKQFLEYYAKTYPHIESADTLIIDDHKNTNILQTIEKYTINNFFEYDSDTYNYPVSFYASMIRNQLPVAGKRTDYPIAVTFPYSLHYAVNVQMPLHWDIAPKTEKIDRNAYSFVYQVSADNDMLRLDYTLTFLKDNIAPGEITQYEKDRKKITNDYLSYGFTYSKAGAGTTAAGGANRINYLSVFIFVLVWAGCAYAGFRVYTIRTVSRLYPAYSPRAIGGWLIFPAIGLIFSAVRVVYYLVHTGFFRNAVWHAYDGFSRSAQFRALLWGELVLNTVTASLAIFCIYLFFKKRDILPRYIRILYISSLIFVIADSVFGHWILPSIAIDYKNIFQTLIPLVVWGSYFSVSERVKSTFIVPYPVVGYTEYDYSTDHANTSEVHEQGALDPDGLSKEQSSDSISPSEP